MPMNCLAKRIYKMEANFQGILTDNEIDIGEVNVSGLGVMVLCRGIHD